MRLFDPEHIFMRILTKITNLILLNWMFLLCSIPVVTLGASLTALHSVSLQMIRGEEPSVVGAFFRAFRENFLQGSALFFLMLFAALLIVGDFLLVPILMHGAAVVIFYIATGVILFLWLMIWPYLFPQQARYANTVPETLKNAAILGMTNLPSTVLIIGLSIAIPVLMYIFPNLISLILQLSLFILFSGQTYLCDRIVDHVFLRTIPEEYALREKPNAAGLESDGN